MRDFLRNTRAILLAVAVHVVVLAVLAMSFDWHAKPAGAAAKPVTEPVVQASVVDAGEVEKEISKLKQKELVREKKEAEQQQRLKKLLSDARQAESKRKAEEKHLAKLKADKQKLEKERKAEQQRLATLEKQRKAEAEKERKLAAEKKRKQKERQAALEKKKADEKKQAAEDMQEQLAAEQQQRQAMSALDRFIPMIQQHVRRHWNQPPNALNMVSKVRVRLTPGGEVLNAAVVLSSGNAAFDRSVEYAVYRSSPLPLPSDPALARLLRKESIVFTFDPSKQG
ncbi:MAG: cell envelope integrity protein TolA [Gammaproteobacteria bacterium]|nr:cell envelope integrity protein TolA [Gammaproteobacteria bacterium]